MQSPIRALSFFLMTLSAAIAGPLVDGFRNPPPECSLQAWWHWLDDCVTEEGIARDLKAMGEAGIGTAYIFAPHMSDLKATATVMSDDWLKLFEYAIQEAKKNGIKLGFHNCPGWSSSGGPWIKVEDSMKILTTSHTDVDLAASGEEQDGRIELPRPYSRCDFYRDLAVFAFPIPETPRIVKGAVPSEVPLKLGEPSVYELEYAEPFAPKLVVFDTVAPSVMFKLKVEALIAGEWRKCAEKKYEIFRETDEAKTIALKEGVESAKWRVTFEYLQPPPWIPKRNLPINFALGDFPLADCETAIGPAELFDVTAALKGDSITAADLPRELRGKRVRLLRVGYTTTGQGPAPATIGGLECDKLSRRGLDAHWPNMPGRILALPGAKDIVEAVIIDSYEVGNQTWTDGLPAEFARRKNRDFRKSLPAIVGYNVGSKVESAAIRGDFNSLIAELFAVNYYDYFAELCHRAGVKAITEPYGGPFDTFRCGKTSDMPTCEFWLGGELHGSVAQMVAVAEKWGQNVVAAESFTTEAKEGRWQITPLELKRSGDVAWVAGVNQIVMHSYVHQPYTDRVPGCSLGRHGTQLNVNTTWWPEMRAWTDYIRRGQFLLRYGRRGEVRRKFADGKIEGLSRIGPKGEIIWFLLNRSDAEIAIDPAAMGLDEKGRRARVFDAVTGRIGDTFAASGSAQDGLVSLRAKESVFLVFEDGVESRCMTPDDVGRRPSTSIGLDDGWEIVSFDGPGAPRAPLKLARLASWHESSDESLKFFSGRARYRREGAFPAGTLDLGEVRELANVYVDGKKIGCVWCPPFAIEVPAGKTLEIEVVNTWPNRMIGDAILRKAGKEGFTWSNWTGGWSAEDPLKPAGLLGPVTLSPKEGR